MTDSRSDSETTGTERIRETLRDYERAVRSADPEAFARAFHEDTLIARPLVPGGPLITLPLRTYQSAAERLYDGEVNVRETTLRLDVQVGGHVAVARIDFEVAVGEEHYEGTDFLNLAEIGGRWLVTYVLWDVERAARPERP